MTEFRHRIPRIEPEHEPATTRVLEAPRHDARMLTVEAAVVELEHAATMAELREEALLEASMLAEAAVVELEHAAAMAELRKATLLEMLAEAAVVELERAAAMAEL